MYYHNGICKSCDSSSDSMENGQMTNITKKKAYSDEQVQIIPLAVPSGLRRSKARVSFAKLVKIQLFEIPQDINRRNCFYVEDDYARFRRESAAFNKEKNRRKQFWLESQNQSCLERAIVAGSKVLQLVYVLNFADFAADEYAVGGECIDM